MAYEVDLQDPGDSREGDARDAKLRLGSVIQSLRRSQDLSVDALARASGVSSGMISLIERGLGNPSYVNLMRLAAALGTRPEALFSVPDEPIEVAESVAGNGPGTKPAVEVRPVRAATQTVAILRCLSEQSDPVGVTEIARDLGLNPSTCFNLLRTLAQGGMVYFDEGTKTYSLGLGVVEMATRVFRNEGAIGAIQPHLRRIAREHGVSATLWRRTKDLRIVLVSAWQGDNPFQIQFQVGQRMPMLLGAVGRCMAAHSGLSEEELRKGFERLRWGRPMSFDEYYAQVVRAREDSYAIDDGAVQAQLLAAGAAILDPDGIATLGVSAFTFREPGAMDVIRTVALEVKELCGSISRAAQAGLVDMREISDFAGR